MGSALLLYCFCTAFLHSIYQNNVWYWYSKVTSLKWLSAIGFSSFGVLSEGFENVGKAHVDVELCLDRRRRRRGVGVRQAIVVDALESMTGTWHEDKQLRTDCSKDTLDRDRRSCGVKGSGSASCGRSGTMCTVGLRRQIRVVRCYELQSQHSSFFFTLLRPSRLCL